MSKNEYIKLKPTIKKKWLGALRSGKYEQTQGKLVDEQGFCCLGVLGEECALKKDWVWESTWDEDPACGIEEWEVENWEDEGEWQLMGDAGGITFDLMKRWSLDFEAASHLVGMNDNDKASFKKIATWIEENL